MKNYYLRALRAICIVSLLPVLARAQLLTPENVSISFYGKAVDQNGNPVSGAKVSLLLVTSHMSEYKTSQEPMTIQTGEDGKFELTGVTGYAIDKISITKDGYELSEKAPSGEVFGLVPTYKPDASNPVMFKMWKMAGKESLVGSAWRGKVACDGTTNRFDLLHGSKNMAGNLEIICSRTPLQLPPHTNSAFDYSFQITIIGGSIRLTDDEFSYLAPQGGYSETFTIRHKAADPDWTAKVKHEFYIKTPQGQYGRLWVDWYSTQDSPTHLEWDCSINPSGSRNLER